MVFSIKTETRTFFKTTKQTLRVNQLFPDFKSSLQTDTAAMILPIIVKLLCKAECPAKKPDNKRPDHSCREFSLL